MAASSSISRQEIAHSIGTQERSNQIRKTHVHSSRDLQTLAHRASEASLLIRDWRPVDGGAFSATTQWRESKEGFDPLVAAETVRQAGIMLGHDQLKISLQQRFILHHVSLTVDPKHFYTMATPPQIELRVDSSDVRKRNDKVSGYQANVAFRRDATVIATGAASGICCTPAVYRRFRGVRAMSSELRDTPLADPVPPTCVGAASTADVMLSPSSAEGCWQLRVDTSDSRYFDHPLDHVPGILLLEAVRQAAGATLGIGSCRPLSISADFQRFVELLSPCTLKVSLSSARHDQGTVTVTGMQSGLPTFRCELTLAST